MGNPKMILSLILSAISIVVSFQYSHVPQVFRSRFSLSMSDTPSTPDFSKFTVGAEYEGKLVSALPFGIFVDISQGTNVLLPRSVLTKGSYEKLKALADSKSEETIKIELVGISEEDNKLSGKYIPANYKARADISTLDGADLNSKSFKATVVSAHEFGVFAELEDFGVEGLVPASKIGAISGSIQDSFPSGTEIEVQIVEMNVGNKKLVLSIKGSNRPEVGALADIGSNEWMQAAVQSVSNFGLFVRPAGYDSVGLVHASQVPRDLISKLKKRVDLTPGSNKTDVESLFQAGDVVKVRVKSVAVENKKLELSMLPMKSSANEDDGYVVEGRDPEGEELKNFDNNDDNYIDYDAEDTLIWWKGEAYQKTDASGAAVDEEVAITTESDKLVEGTWRRMFELDLREDQADFSSKVLEKEYAELKEDIGELEGLDDELIDSFDIGMDFQTPLKSFGSFVSMSALPTDWKSEMGFVQEVDSISSGISNVLRGGKTTEQAQFEALLKEVESEVSAASGRIAAEAPAPVVEEAAPAPEAAAVEAVADEALIENDEVGV